MKDICELEKCLKDLCKVKYITLDNDEISTPCSVEISYEGNTWAVWLTDEIGSGHMAEAYRYVDGKLIDGALIVGMGYHLYCGDCKNVFADRGKTLEEAVNKLAAKVAILRQNPDCCLLFTWDD